MRAMLSFDEKTGFLEGLHQTRPGNLRQNAQALTSTSVRIMSSVGRGSPSSRRLQRYSSMASRIFVNASSSLSPWEAHPGRLGTYTEKPPVGSGSRMTLYRFASIAPQFYLTARSSSSASGNDDRAGDSVNRRESEAFLLVPGASQSTECGVLRPLVTSAGRRSAECSISGVVNGRLRDDDESGRS